MPESEGRGGGWAERCEKEKKNKKEERTRHTKNLEANLYENPILILETFCREDD